MSTTIAAIPEILAGGVIERLPSGEQIAIFKPEDLRSDHFVVRGRVSARLLLVAAGQVAEIVRGIKTTGVSVAETPFHTKPFPVAPSC